VVSKHRDIIKTAIPIKDIEMRTSIWWIRRDLRLSDNMTLTAAVKSGDHILPVFILDPSLLSSSYVGDGRVAFLLEGLHHLKADLEARGGRLILRKGHPLLELKNLVEQSGAEGIYAEEDFSPYAKQRDRQVAADLPLHLLHGLTVHHPLAVVKADGSPYKTYTPFQRAWKSLPFSHRNNLLPIPDGISTPPDIDSDPIPNHPTTAAIKTMFPPGERQASKHLNAFVNGDDPPIHYYADQRDRLDTAGTSQLSPYLRFGMLSPRQAVNSARLAMEMAPNEKVRRGAETWLNELIWREFYIAILYHFPHVRAESFRANLRSIPWENSEAAFLTWCDGRTGYPLIDAAMRQLLQTGWMHNRGRMIVASFLVKDLLIDWRWGERWFMQHLVDGDPASNNGGWQWTAGTGTDAAPYFRIFNPVLQSKKFDPHGKFIRNWVPELQKVTGKFIHEPWKMSSEMQKETGCIIGVDYPEPIVDHAIARKRTLEAFAFAKEKSGSRK
jgi:deoxyribodipyrimidine photo-lyase